MNSYSTFKSRLFAGLIDGLILCPVFLAYYYIDQSSKVAFTGYHIMYIASYMLYAVYFHGKRGQTVGKRVMKIQVLDRDETSLIGYKRAFLRDCVWLLIYLAGCIYLLFISRHSENLNAQHVANFDLFFATITAIWLLFELICFWATIKRRAVHDFLANSVVVKL